MFARSGISWCMMVVGALAFSAGPALAQCGWGDKQSGKTASSGHGDKSGCGHGEKARHAGYTAKKNCGDKSTVATSECTRDGNDIVSVAMKAGQFDTLLKAVKAAGMKGTLQGEGPFTVFAPTDEAFSRLPDGALQSLMKDPSKLRAVLKYHVVPAKVSASDVKKMATARTALGQNVRVRHFFDIRIDDAKVISADIQASNGVIHVIDSVLMPADDVLDVAAKAGGFDTLVKAVYAAGLADALRGQGPFTVFAPTDEAFAKLPPGTVEALLNDPARLSMILKYHVLPARVSGQEIRQLTEARTLLGQTVPLRTASPTHVGDATVIKKDIKAANGVIHVIDSVLMPAENILCAAKCAGSFNTLLTAIDAAGLNEALSGPGPFTVFAPTDAAFAALPEGTLQSLLDNPEKLAAILKYHVVAGELPAAKVLSSHEAGTLHGDRLRFSNHDGVVRAGKARILETDIRTGNGIIHVIDTVLIPE